MSLQAIIALISSLILLPNGRPVDYFRRRPGEVEMISTWVYEDVRAELRKPVIALMWRESSFRRNALGKAGERGLLQIHPRSKLRPRCSDEDSIECDRARFRAGVRVLEQGLAKCQDIPHAIAWYRSGHCEPNEKTLAGVELVLATLRNLD